MNKLKMRGIISKKNVVVIIIFRKEYGQNVPFLMKKTFYKQLWMQSYFIFLEHIRLYPFGVPSHSSDNHPKRILSDSDLFHLKFSRKFSILKPRLPRQTIESKTAEHSRTGFQFL